MWKFIESLSDLSLSIKITITQKTKKNEIWFLFRFSRFRIFHINSTTFEEKNYFSILMVHTHACKTLKPSLAKYAVDANLFRLESTNSKKNIQPLDAFWWGAKPPTKMNWNIFFLKCLNIFEQKIKIIEFIRIYFLTRAWSLYYLLLNWLFGFAK